MAGLATSGGDAVGGAAPGSWGFWGEGEGEEDEGSGLALTLGRGGTGRRAYGGRREVAVAALDGASGGAKEREAIALEWRGGDWNLGHGRSFYRPKGGRRDDGELAVIGAMMVERTGELGRGMARRTVVHCHQRRGRLTTGGAVQGHGTGCCYAPGFARHRVVAVGLATAVR